jgi:hypothetical protein
MAILNSGVPAGGTTPVGIVISLFRSDLVWYDREPAVRPAGHKAKASRFFFSWYFMPLTKAANDEARFFAALGVPIQLAIFRVLINSEYSLKELTVLLRLDGNSVRHHIQTLDRGGVDLHGPGWERTTLPTGRCREGDQDRPAPRRSGWGDSVPAFETAEGVMSTRLQPLAGQIVTCAQVAK